MASKKKVKKKAGKKVGARPRRPDAAVYADFIANVQDGTLGAVVTLYESRDGNGELVIEFDEEVDDV